MLSRFFKPRRDSSADLTTSELHDEKTFYKAFMNDLSACREEAIIESPFITSNRIASLLPFFEKMRSRKVQIIVNTRHPAEHDFHFNIQASEAIKCLQNMGVQILYTGGHHRKLAILDRHILWEGSLNILSQNDSCEIMRRTKSAEAAMQMLHFTKLHKYITE